MRSEYEVFIKAAESGNMDALEQIIARFSPEEVQAMIQTKERYGRDVDYAAFRKAAANGHLDVMKRLRELAPDQVQAMIKADDYAAFRDAASHGHLAVIEWLRELAPDRVQVMIQAVQYFAYRFASGRHPAVMERLIAWSAPETVSNMIKANGRNFVRDSGLFDIMDRLVEIAPNQLKAIIPEENYALFRQAAFDGRLAVMEQLIALVPDQVQAMIQANKYAAFVEAAGNGHLAVMERLMELAPDQVQAMIKAGDYYAFVEAAGHGHLAVMERLMELAPDQVQAMIKAGDYYAFVEAAGHGHLAVMERLIGQSTPYRVQEMIQADDYAAFRNAVDNGHTNVIHYLLTFPNMLAWAERHEHEYGSRCVYPFVNEQLQSLRTQKSALETENPNAVFDIDAEKAKLCFFMLRNLIRRNDASVNDDIRFLLNIPAVKSIVHTQVTPAGPNELLRLAMTTDRNPEAAGILLTIPAVRRQAEQNHFYRHEVRGGLDLQALAQDRESSMRALSIGEQKRLDRTFKRYQPMLEEAGGVEAVFQSFIDVLNARYQARPAQIRTGNGRDIALPVTRGEFNHLFNALQLSEETRERARLAYYQHKDHTALRYVSRPNAWMADHAAFVNRDSSGRWSTFEEYKPLISMLWLAATDTDIVPTDGYTVETRINHFIDEIALLGRAHNWDRSRPILNEEGAPILDELGHVIREEFDDGEGDKPSCYSGVKRRLFQSVLGHPLLKILTLDDIKQELRDFVRDYFKQHITDSNRDAIRTAWVNLCESGSYDATQHDSLNILNIPSETQITFIQHLGEKYPAQFNDELTFKRYVESQFLMDERFQTHAARFGGQTDLNGLLTSPALIMRSIITSSDLHKAKSRLSRCGEPGEAVIAEINCLKSGSISLGSATWTGSAEKLSAIVTAVKALPEEMSAEDLVAILMNEHSDLCKSLTQSISTVLDAEPPDATFLKKFKRV